MKIKLKKIHVLKIGLPFVIGAILAFFYQWKFKDEKCPEVTCEQTECPKQESCKTVKDVCVPCKDCGDNRIQCKRNAMKYHQEYVNIMKRLYSKANTFSVLSEKDYDELMNDIDTFIALFKKITGIDMELKIGRDRETERKKIVEWGRKKLEENIKMYRENSKDPKIWEDIKAENINYRNKLN